MEKQRGKDYGFKTLLHWNNMPLEDQMLLHQALDRLAADNPGIVKQLEGLADLKEKEPQKWALGLKILKLN